LLCAMTGIFVLSAMMPNYLVDYVKLTSTQMGIITSAIGFGGALGQFGLLTVSDYIGRRPATVLSFIIAAVFLWLFIHAGSSLPVLFALLFVAAMFNFGALAILAGPIPAEAAPVGLVASAAGLVIGAGEISTAHTQCRRGTRFGAGPRRYHHHYLGVRGYARPGPAPASERSSRCSLPYGSLSSMVLSLKIIVARRVLSYGTHTSGKPG
jgi:hypothetical protein